MLQSMRHLAQNWLFKGLLLFLVISFAIWGIGDIFRGNPMHRMVAKAGDVKLTAGDLNAEFQRTFAYARQLMGPDFSAEKAKQMGLMNTALNNLVERALIDQETKRLGIKVSVDTAINQIRNEPQFQKDGKFDTARFRQFMIQNKITEKDLTNNMARLQLASVLQPQSDPSAPMVAALYMARGQKRIFDVVSVNNKEIADAAEPTEAELKKFYDDNVASFTAPEYRGITIAVLSSDDIAKDTSVSDEQVEKSYNTDDRWTKPEQRDFTQVVLQDETKAKDLAAKAKATGNLSDAAKSLGLSTAPLNAMQKDALPTELAAPLFALPANGITDAIKTTLGWHIVQVKKITASAKPPLKDIRTEVKDALQHDQAIESTTRIVNQLDDQLAAGTSLEEIADAMKLRVIKFAAVDDKGMTAEGMAAKEMPTYIEVLKSAFAQNGGEVSPILDDNHGHFYVVRTDNVTPSAPKPFDTVKNDVRKAWHMAQQGKLAAKEAEKIAEGLKAGKPASSFAAQKGVDVRVSKPVSLLGDHDKDIPDTLMPQVLRLKKGEVTVAAEGDKQVILRLANIIEADKGEMERSSIGIKDELRVGLGRELTEQYFNHLRVLFPVTIDQETFMAASSQGGDAQ